MSLDFTQLGEDFAAFVADPTTESSIVYANNMGLKVSHTQDIRGHRYHIVRYDKAKYGNGNGESNSDSEENRMNMTDDIAMLRSIIIADGKIRCVSLPKATRAMPEAPNQNTTVMVEGPMVNSFYYADEGCSGDDNEGKGWQLTTRSVFGARNSYFDDEDGNQMTFRQMFLEAMPADFNDTHDRNSCYSFVVRHPKNRDVYGTQTPTLIRVATFTPRDNTNMIWDYTGPDMNGVLTDFDSSSMGRTAAWEYNGRLVRAKELSGDYKSLRILRGTQPKLKFHYLSLRKRRGGVSQYLSHFPEHGTVFSTYRDQIHEFTKELQRNYWDCYVRRSKPLREYDGRFKMHMFNLHTAFKENKKPQLIPEVIRYVNGLSPAQLMFSLNFEHRPQRPRREPSTETDTNVDAGAGADGAGADMETDDNNTTNELKLFRQH